MLFFSKIGSFMSLLIQIAIVVTAVLLFSFFDPFGMFKPSVPKLEDTPVSLRSIRSIGELISAEYYGEVIVSLKGKYIEEIDTTATAFAKKANTLNDDFQAAIEELKEQDSVRFRGFSKGRKIKEYFHATFPDLTSDPNYHAFIEALLKKLGERNEQNLLKRLYKEKLSADKLKVDPAIFEDFKKEELNALYADKFKRNRQLVILGRGWVKAGFDFGSFTEKNFRYDEDKKIVHFIGLEPTILSAVINPWFIPEKGVKGFEIVLASNKNNPEHVLEAKREALNKLRSQALQRDILSQARENARENLREFFSLLLDTDIEDVVFHTSELIYNYQSIVADDTINGAELLVIDSLVNRHWKTARRETMAFVDSLKKHRVCYLGRCDSFRYDPFAAVAFGIARDESFTPQDVRLMTAAFLSVNQVSQLDSVWFNIHRGKKPKDWNWTEVSDSIKMIKCCGTYRLEKAVKANIRKEFITPGTPWPASDLCHKINILECPPQKR